MGHICGCTLQVEGGEWTFLDAHVTNRCNSLTYLGLASSIDEFFLDSGE